MHYNAVNFVFYVSFHRGSKKEEKRTEEEGTFREEFMFQTFSRNDIPGEAPPSRGHSVFKKEKEEEEKKRKIF